LKRHVVHAAHVATGVAPVSAPGRGLKLDALLLNLRCKSSPRCPHRGAD